MTYTSPTIVQIRNKLYQNKRNFKNFEGITKERLAEIAKKVAEKTEMRNENNNKNYSPLNRDKLSIYYDTLIYLTNNLIHTQYTFDERIIFLIMTVDPELISFKEFLNTELIPTKTIADTTNPKEKATLILKRDEQLKEMQNRIRTKIGFYDANLIAYEKEYFKIFLKEKELIRKVKQDYATSFLSSISIIKSLNSVTEERKKELEEKAFEWISLTNAQNDIKTAAYSVSTQHKTIGLKTITEQIVFFILIADSNLDMLRIYEEESKMDIVEERIIEQFGYFNINIIKLEKIYHERFCPTKRLSPWTF